MREVMTHAPCGLFQTNLRGENIMRQVVFIPDNNSQGFTAIVPSLLGCISEGDTFEEAVANIKEAMELYIEDMIEDGEEIPEDVNQPIRVVPLWPFAPT
jgi:predicted RNase H-like HicB family nuclease